MCKLQQLNTVDGVTSRIMNGELQNMWDKAVVLENMWHEAVIYLNKLSPH
jgi:hypothetical protein